MSHILGCNITIISTDSMWHAMDQCANDISYVYLGESKFIKMEVGKFLLTCICSICNNKKFCTSNHIKNNGLACSS